MCKSLRKKQILLWKVIQNLGIFLVHQRLRPIQNDIKNPQWQLTPPLLSTGEGEIIDAL